jgi:hypothetical protein
MLGILQAKLLCLFFTCLNLGFQDLVSAFLLVKGANYGLYAY